MDFSTGGIWEFVMHGPEGHNYKNRIRFTEIKKPHLIAYVQLGHGEDIQEVNFQSRIIFEEAGGGTNLIMEQIFLSKEELERICKTYGAIEGAKQHLAKLGKFLQEDPGLL